MSRKRIYASAADRVKAHIERHGGRRVSLVLRNEAVTALEFLREDTGLSDTQLVNHALVALAASRLNHQQL